MKRFKIMKDGIQIKKNTRYMSIIKCYECSGKLRDKANSCPNCGAPSMNTNNQKNSLAFIFKKIIGILLILWGIILITSWLMDPSQGSEDSFSSNFFFFLGAIVAPIYFGIKLYNQTDILIVFVNWIKNGFK